MRRFSGPNSTMVTWGDYLLSWSVWDCGAYLAEFFQSDPRLNLAPNFRGQMVFLEFWLGTFLSAVVTSASPYRIGWCWALASTGLSLLVILGGYIWNRNFSVHICIYNSQKFLLTLRVWKWGGRICPWTLRSALRSNRRLEYWKFYNWTFYNSAHSSDFDFLGGRKLLPL